MNVWIEGKVEILEDEVSVILIDGIPSFFEYEGLYYPTVLLLLHNTPASKYVTVDMGAVKHVLNGANVFAAGIVDADAEISPGSGVYVRDEKYHKPIAVGIALMNGADMVNSKSGAAVKTLHYYGDVITNYS